MIKDADKNVTTLERTLLAFTAHVCIETAERRGENLRTPSHGERGRPPNLEGERLPPSGLRQGVLSAVEHEKKTEETNPCGEWGGERAE